MARQERGETRTFPWRIREALPPQTPLTPPQVNLDGGGQLGALGDCGSLALDWRSIVILSVPKLALSRGGFEKLYLLKRRSHPLK